MAQEEILKVLKWVISDQLSGSTTKRHKVCLKLNAREGEDIVSSIMKIIGKYVASIIRKIESMSIWVGASADAWLPSKQLLTHRTMLKCEREAQKYNQNPDVFYEIGCDIGRYRANSAVSVLKVFPSKTGAWKKKLVYIETIHGESLIDQACKIKEIIQKFNPREVVIDGNGLYNRSFCVKA